MSARTDLEDVARAILRRWDIEIAVQTANGKETVFPARAMRDALAAALEPGKLCPRRDTLAAIAEAVPESEEPALCSCGDGYQGHDEAHR